MHKNIVKQLIGASGHSIPREKMMAEFEQNIK
jgi:hypothetical protein